MARDVREGWVEVQGKYLHTLGNLTLTGYNSELSDRPFQEKKSMEEVSTILLFASIHIWGESVRGMKSKYLCVRGNWLRKLKKYGGFRYYRRRHSKFIDLRREILQSIRWSTMNIWRRHTYSVSGLAQKDNEYRSFRKEELRSCTLPLKEHTNFVDVVPQKSRLRLSLNVAFADILDPKGLCKDVSNLGRWGNGDVEVGISNMNELDDIMELIQQAFDKQMEANWLFLCVM